MTFRLDGLGARRYLASAMARPLRIDSPKGRYHVTSRGLERRAIVRQDRDREHWLKLLERQRRLAARIRRCVEQMSNVKT